MIIEMPPPFRSDYFAFDFAQEAWERRQYHDVRKQIFCEEQQLFTGSDLDEIDQRALPIVAISNCGGMLDRVVGVVRIDERKPGVWYGSRLGVVEQYRKLTRFDIFNLFENSQPIAPFNQSIGAALIYKAVSTANALGARQFYATVQEQNVRFFEKMHWRTIYTMTLHNYPHALMEVDLNQYPPSMISLNQLGLAA